MPFAALHARGASELAALRSRAAFPALALVLSALLGLALFINRDLPMLDLPQHAVQVSTWMRWSSLPAAEHAELELNLRTPYLLAYALARVSAPLLGVVPALKVLVIISALGNLLAVRALSRRTGHSVWLSLLALPLTFGFSFYFGFVSFLFATPLVVLSLVWAFDHALKPTVARALALGALLSVVLLAHGFAFCIALLSVAPMLVLGLDSRWNVRRMWGDSSASFVLRVAPLAAPVVLGFLWLAPAPREPGLYDATIPPDRAFRWLSMLCGAGSFRDYLAVSFGLVFLAALSLSLGRVSRAPGRAAPLAVVVLGYALVPEMLWNTAFLHQRLLGFLLPALLLAFEPSRSKRNLGALNGAIAVASAVWLFAFSIRLELFNREMKHYHALTARLPSGLEIRPLIFARESRAFPGPPLFLHVSAYYYAERGGIPAYSFAVQPTSVIRYRRGHSSRMSPGSEWVPERFAPEKDAEGYDYWLLRGGPAAPGLLSRAPLPMVLDACSGSFCGYRLAHAGELAHSGGVQPP